MAVVIGGWWELVADDGIYWWVAVVIGGWHGYWWMAVFIGGWR